MSSEALLQKIDTLTQGVVQRDIELKTLRLTIEKLNMELSYLKRMRYGRASEKMDSPDSQLELLGAALAPIQNGLQNAVESGVPSPGSNVTDLEDARSKRQAKSKRPTLRHLPEHLPREEIVHIDSRGCQCSACGAGLREMGQDVSEVQEYEPGSFKVIRHVRPKLVCVGCHTITQAPVLSPGRGKTKTARLWVYARDDRPGGDTSPAAVWFQYSPNRKGENPLRHLAGFTGVLQADAYAGYDRLFADGRIVEAACWAHYLEPGFMRRNWPVTPPFVRQHGGELTRHNLHCCIDFHQRVGEWPCRFSCALNRPPRSILPAVNGVKLACSCAPCTQRAAVLWPVMAATHA